MSQFNYASEESFQAYVEFTAIKRHFVSSYDYHKYNGKVNLKYATYQTRKDVPMFVRLANCADYKHRILSVVLNNPKCWVGEVLGGLDTYHDWKDRVDNLESNLEADLSSLDGNLGDWLKVSSGGHPRLLSELLKGNVLLETVTVLIHLTNVVDYWQTEIADKIIAKDKLTLMQNYYPFLKEFIDRETLVPIISSHK